MTGYSTFGSVRKMPLPQHEDHSAHAPAQVAPALPLSSNSCRSGALRAAVLPLLKPSSKSNFDIRQIEQDADQEKGPGDRWL
jgi:hypothetical protein